MDEKLKSQSAKYLNDIRLFRYYKIGNDNYLEMYLLNMNVSEKILSMISVFEVIFRNKIDNLLSKSIGTNYLTNSTIFNDEEKKLTKRAYKKAEKASIKITDSRALTYLTLGFWCGLIENNKLWCKYLYKIFPREIRKANTLRSIIKKINSILYIRNMISHHERIISKPGIDILGISNNIIELTLWLIDSEDQEFLYYIKPWLDSKSNEIRSLLKK